MRSYPNPTMSPMQAKLFSATNKFMTPKQYNSTLSARALPNLESSLSKMSSSTHFSYSNVYGNYGNSLFLTPSSSQFSQISNNSNISKVSSSSSKLSLKNSYMHTEYDHSSKRLQSQFFEKPMESGIYTGSNRPQSTLNQDNYKKKFYNHSGQLNDGVIYNKSYGQNNVEIEQFEDTKSPFNYFKICTRNGDIISTSTVRPHHIPQLLQNNEYMPSRLQ